MIRLKNRQEREQGLFGGSNEILVWVAWEWLNKKVMLSSELIELKE